MADDCLLFYSSKCNNLHWLAFVYMPFKCQDILKIIK